MNADDAARLATADLDFEALGFRCGLEIHQQLDTHRLFSPCPSRVVDPDEVARSATAAYDRRLRATASELGDVDVAAAAEARRRLAFRYLAIDGLTSLVEMDEEPPHPMDAEALDVVLTFAGLVGARPADEVHVMRKTVIDGSNTSGFQRTALVATGGGIDVEGAVGIWTIAVEEDSARKVDAKDKVVTYSLDRLGIPLIEVATAPDIRNPQHAQQTAARIGALLRATGRVKRGLGTIRQDLNVSIGVGDRVEIKGCQDLRAVARVIEQECRRQLWMHHIRLRLQERGFDAASIGETVDVTDAFASCQSKMVQGALKRGDRVMALGLPSFGGLIAAEGPAEPLRLGRELADHAKVATGVKGIFHSDELPAYGIAEEEVEAVRTQLSLGGKDAFVLCVERARVASDALEAVAERARLAAAPPQREVRAAQPDDTTRYMRPLPGAARMYPETDVPPISIPADRWQEVLGRLPPLPEQRVAAYVEDHGLSQDLAHQLVKEGMEAPFEALAGQAEAPLVARVLLQFLPSLDDPARVEGHLPGLFAALAEGGFAKEALPELLRALDGDASLDVPGAIAAAGVEAAGDDAVDEVVRRVVADRADFVKERGMAAMGPLMGPVMAELRGKADGAKISARLKRALEETLEG